MWKLLYLSLELSNFNEIWYAYANFDSEDGHMTGDPIFYTWRVSHHLLLLLCLIVGPYELLSASYGVRFCELWR